MIPQCLLGTHTGLRVSSLALGGARLVDGLPTLHAFAAAGGTLIDTSSAYQGGASEETIGRFLADAGRDAFVICSKYGRTTSAEPPAAAVGNHRGALLREVEGSLRRLRTDRIDLYYPHFDDAITPIEEIVRGLEDLTRAGKIVHIGISNFPAWRAAEAQALSAHPIAALQMQYSLAERAIEREHLPFARARGIAMLGWSPLAGGLLAKGGAGKVHEALASVAAETSATAAVVATAWVCAKGVIPILGPKTPEHLAASLPAASLVLTPAQLTRLDDASALTLGYPYDLLAQQHARMGIAVRT